MSEATLKNKTNMSQSELRHLSTKEINKMIRKALKDEFGKKMKFSVRKTGWNSIRIEVKKADATFFMTREEFEEENSYSRVNFSWNWENMVHRFERNDYIALKPEIREKIETIANQWNFDNSDIMTDYFDVNYYLNVTGEEIELI